MMACAARHARLRGRASRARAGILPATTGAGRCLAVGSAALRESNCGSPESGLRFGESPSQAAT